jgi:hypothetical protein
MCKHLVLLHSQSTCASPAAFHTSTYGHSLPSNLQATTSVHFTDTSIPSNLQAATSVHFTDTLFHPTCRLPHPCTLQTLPFHPACRLPHPCTLQTLTSIQLAGCHIRALYRHSLPSNLQATASVHFTPICAIRPKG